MSDNNARMVQGLVRSVKAKKAKKDSYEIHIPKDRADGLPFVVGQRVPIKLKIKDSAEVFEAGIRATARNSYVWICPDLFHNGERLSLCDLLETNNIWSNSRVELMVVSNTVQLLGCTL